MHLLAQKGEIKFIFSNPFLTRGVQGGFLPGF